MYSVTPKQHLRLHNIETELKKRIAYKKSEYCSGLSMNILHAGGQFIARPRVSGWAV